MEEAKTRYQTLLKDEMQQPYVFRDKSLIIAENILLFDGLYEKLWTKMGIIASGIHMVNIGLHAEDAMSHLPQHEIISTPLQKEMMLDQNDSIDIWNQSLTNYKEEENEVFMNNY